MEAFSWIREIGTSVCGGNGRAGDPVVAPAVVWAQATITGTVKDTSGALLPGVTVEASSPGADRKSPSRRQRRHGTVPHREPAAGHLHGEVHADRIQHRRARRRGVVRLGDRQHQRRHARRRARRDDHGDRRVARRGPAERPAPDGADQRCDQGHPDGRQLQRASRPRARRCSADSRT